MPSRVRKKRWQPRPAAASAPGVPARWAETTGSCACAAGRRLSARGADQTRAHPERRGGKGPGSTLDQLPLELVQHPVARQHLGDAAVGLAAFADRGEELAVLQLDAVHADVDLGDVDLLVLAVEQVIVARDVGRAVADVAEERAQRPVVVEAETQR